MITIIILLILASVSIVALRNTDLFGKTQQATEYYKQQAEIENETLESYGRTLNEYLEGRASGGGSADVPFDNSNLNKTSARLGKTINYTTQPLSDSTFTLSTYPGIEYRPDGTNAMSATNTGRTETLTWKVLSEDTNGNLLITTTTPTTAKVYLNKDRNRESGAAAYDNAVQAIDAYCYKYFSNETAGVEARNIKIEDIEAHETNAGTSARTGYTKYNTLVTPINHAYYPSIYPQETDNNLGLSEYYPTTSKYAPNTTATHAVYNSTKYSSYKSTCYYFSNSNITNNNYYDTTTKDILFTSTGYGSGFWLASRCVNFDSSNAYFDVRYVSHWR